MQIDLLRNDMPRISVITPVYNAEETIQETIQSVLHQTFSDFELIVINDGSKDSTLEVISNISDSRIKVFSYPNSHKSLSRNRGIFHSIGEYIAFIDSDDLWLSEKLEKQLEFLQKNPQASVAYSWTDCIDENGKFLRPGSRATFNGNVYAHLLIVDFISNGSNPLIRREAIEQVGGFNQSFRHAEDWDLWLRLASRYNFVAVPYPHILYRQRSGSSSSNVLSYEAGVLEVIGQAFNQAPKSLQYLKSRSIANIYKYLTFKSLQTNLSQEKALIASRFFYSAVQNDKSLLRKKIFLKVLLKIILMRLLPPQKSQDLFDKYKNWFDTSTLLGYLKSEL